MPLDILLTPLGRIVTRVLISDMNRANWTMLLGHRLLEGNCGHFLAVSISKKLIPFFWQGVVESPQDLEKKRVQPADGVQNIQCS